MKTVKNLRGSYRSYRDNLPQDFFVPCLKQCSVYKRAVGFFTSTSLNEWVDAVDNLVESDDLTIKLLIAPILSDSDKRALNDLHSDPDLKTSYLEKSADNFILEFLDDSKLQQLRNRDLLLWLIAHDRLELKFAFISDTEDEPGMYHEKLGVFEFPTGEKVAFEGSANETISGYKRNKEKICVFRSWVEQDKDRILDTESDFETTWRDDEPGLEVFELSTEILKRVVERAPAHKPTRKKPTLVNKDKWKHQIEAIDIFLKEKAGILEMATGTGKTRTALEIAKRLSQENLIDSVIVTTDGNDLLNQWYEEILEKIDDIPNMEFVFRQYKDNRELMGYCLNPKKSILIVARQDKLSQAIKNLPQENHQRTLVIHDEIHGMGSQGNIASLSGTHSHFIYKLGLSATPEREYDSSGTQFIDECVGPVIYEFSLQKAIEAGILCEFDYIPIEYVVSEDDKMRLKNVRAQAAARRHEGRPMPDSELYTKLANVYKTAENKPFEFKAYLEDHKECINNCIIFVETREYGERLYPMLHEVTHSYRSYYAEDDSDNLHRFSEGGIDCLITCHKISQGIDISRLEKVILFASSAAKLETIQRIGRCLRTDPLNEEKRATIIDFVRPAEEDNQRDNADDVRKSWLTELSTTKRKEQ